MPVFVDHEQRREQIITAAFQVLGQHGHGKFTLRAVGERLGGSVTLVTHYFPSRDALLDGILQRTLADAQAKQEQLLAIPDPASRLNEVLRYFLLLDEEDVVIERARVGLSANRDIEPTVALHLEQIDHGMRELVRAAIADFVPADRLDATVDVIRLWTAGVVLTAIEHPDVWTAERQLEALDHFIGLLDLPLGKS
ncbi:TetR/AcrR family transcriptional regulator [Geodermatophilus nigrescens]